MLKVAVTGTLSSGKSTVCQLFEELGAYVISADALVHQLLDLSHPLGRQVVRLLGDEIVLDGSIDRSAIAKKVFSHANLLAELERLLHPAVRQAIQETCEAVQKRPSPPPLFVAEIPLLFEGGTEGLYDVTVTVTSSENLCRQRFQAATGYDDEEFDRRMGRQLPQEDKVRRADFVISNEGDRQQLSLQVKRLFLHLTKKRESL